MKISNEISIGHIVSVILVVGSITMSYAQTQSDITLLKSNIDRLPIVVDKLEKVILEVTRHDERLKQCQIQ